MAGTINNLPISTKSWTDFPLNSTPEDSNLIMMRSGTTTSPMTLQTSKQVHNGILEWDTSFPFKSGGYCYINGVIYQAKQDNQGQNPEADTLEVYWESPSKSLKAGRRNFIDNGDFQVFQEGSSQTSSGYGSDDRWVNEHSGSTKTHSIESFVKGQNEVKGNPLYYSRTVVSSVSGASNYVRKFQRIEGVETFSGETVTLSFWARADSNKSIAVDFFQSFGSGGSTAVNSIAPTTFALTTSFKRYSVTVQIPTIAGKTVGANSFMGPSFWFDAGSDYNSRTNSLGNQSGTFDIADVQIEPLPFATSFERLPLSDVERRCFHHYRRIPMFLGNTNYQESGNWHPLGKTLADPMRVTPITNVIGQSVTVGATRTSAGIYLLQQSSPPISTVYTIELDSRI